MQKNSREERTRNKEWSSPALRALCGSRLVSEVVQHHEVLAPYTQKAIREDKIHQKGWCKWEENGSRDIDAQRLRIKRKEWDGLRLGLCNGGEMRDKG